MTTAFDSLARSYDTQFSHAEIGKRLRQLVWDYVDSKISGKLLDILEINCGTGEDAVHFAANGHRVTATDVSTEMIDVANSKYTSDKIVFQTVDFTRLNEHYEHESFDLVFSNFGGLNCVDDKSLQITLANIHHVLKPNGRFIGVIMGSHCVWEMIYYLLKFNTDKSFRRFRQNGVSTHFGNDSFKTFYFSPQQLKKLIPQQMVLDDVKPLGLFLPPTYLEHYFSKHVSQLDKLLRLEKIFNRYSGLSNFADHYVVTVTK